MGLSISWLACRSEASDEVKRQLGCAPTGEFGDYPRLPLVGHVLPSGWYLLVANRCGHAAIKDATLSVVSQISPIVTCSIEEHVNFCSSSYWADNRRIWAVEHESDRGEFDLRVEGIPPDDLAQIRQSVIHRQASEGGDEPAIDFFFDIPLELAKRIVGFRHDERTPGVEAESFEVLRIVEGGLLTKFSRPWWRFW
jgi:hypothetical protein